MSHTVPTKPARNLKRIFELKNSRLEIPGAQIRFDFRVSAELGAAQLLAGLEWIYRHGFSTPPILARLLQDDHNLASKLRNWCESGWIKKVAMPTALTRHVFILAPNGLALLQAHSDDPLEQAVLDPSKISWRRVVHDHCVQHATLKFLKPEATEYASELELKGWCNRGEKIVDAAVRNEKSHCLGLEVEMTAKPRSQMNRALRGQYRLIEEKVFDRIYILTSSEGLARRIREAANGPIPEYEYLERSWHLIKHSAYVPSDSIRDAIAILVYPEFRELIK